MSYLKQLTDADKAMRTAGAGPCMHIHVGYSLAAEVAKHADLGKALEGWKAVAESDRYVITSPAGEQSEVFFLGYSDDHCDTELLRELAQALTDETPPAPAKPEPVFLVWTDADSRAAAAEGWDVFAVSGMVDRNHLAIQRLDETGRFGSDEEAIWHVYNEAVRKRSALHRKAMAVTLAETNGR